MKRLPGTFAARASQPPARPLNCRLQQQIVDSRPTDYLHAAVDANSGDNDALALDPDWPGVGRSRAVAS